MNITVFNIGHHRNGIDGAPFHAIVFRDEGPETSVKLGIVFDTSSHVAVLDIAKLADCDVEFASNSWRGDVYEPPLRKAIKDYRRTGEAETDDVDRQSPIGINDLLAQRRQVAVIWSTEDVLGVRPDLTDDQAWQVLQQCRDHHDCELGFNWLLIETVAEDLFPEPASTEE
jgi:hypothetical protein